MIFYMCMNCHNDHSFNGGISKCAMHNGYGLNIDMSNALWIYHIDIMYEMLILSIPIRINIHYNSFVLLITMTSWYGTFTTSLALCEGNPPVQYGALMLSLMYAWTNGRKTIELRRWFETSLTLMWRLCKCKPDDVRRTYIRLDDSNVSFVCF